MHVNAHPNQIAAVFQACCQKECSRSLCTFNTISTRASNYCKQRMAVQEILANSNTSMLEFQSLQYRQLYTLQLVLKCSLSKIDCHCFSGTSQIDCLCFSGTSQIDKSYIRVFNDTGYVVWAIVLSSENFVAIYT